MTGISEFLPGALIDAALFDPCGYSANGLLDVSKLEKKYIVANLVKILRYFGLYFEKLPIPFTFTLR